MTRTPSSSPNQDPEPPSSAEPAGDALARLARAASEGRGPAPVEKWNPAYCGEIDLRIGSDGTWFYQGSPIGRPALVRLFASVLRRDPDRFVLVTPVERVGIRVDDAPFLAVEMATDESTEGRRIVFRTNLDDLVEVGPDHPLRFERDERDGIKPYVRVRGDLWARVTRALTYDLVDLAEEHEIDDRRVLAVAAGGAVFALADVDEGLDGG